MVSQKLVDAFFPGFSLVSLHAPRGFVIVKEEPVGTTQDRSCAACGALYVPEIHRGVDNNPYPRGRCHHCSPIVVERVYGDGSVSKKGRISVRWSRDLNLDF